MSIVHSKILSSTFERLILRIIKAKLIDRLTAEYRS